MAEHDTPELEPEPPEGMVRLYLGLFKTGVQTDADPARSEQQLQEDQRAHLANFGKLASAGKLLMAGPTPDDTDVRGVVILKAESMQEAESYFAADPHIASGRMRLEIHPWLVEERALKT